MSMRVLLALALIAGVTAPSDARTAQTSKSSKSEKSGKKKGKKSKKKQVSRIPSAATLKNVKNMPRGYVWPPNKVMLAAEDQCASELTEAGVESTPAKSEGRIVSAIALPMDETGAFTLGGVTYRSAFGSKNSRMDCQLALALERFGPELSAAGVHEVKFGSIYRWTNVRVNGETKPILSRHALGIAMDIVSLIDADGREANVKRDYKQDDELLLAAEHAVNASGKFRTLLTPKNDPISHSDHFHIEVAVDYTAPQ
ncbi:MAG TPA: extensin family protein [Kofleriaceae bacterium]|jgi:hypothetical protein